jgi:hypothetical protein
VAPRCKADASQPDCVQLWQDAPIPTKESTVLSEAWQGALTSNGSHPMEGVGIPCAQTDFSGMILRSVGVSSPLAKYCRRPGWAL